MRGPGLGLGWMGLGLDDPIKLCLIRIEGDMINGAAMLNFLISSH